MNRNQAWPGEAPSQLAATSTHELFGSSSGAGGQQQQQPHLLQQQQQDYGQQYASEMGAKKTARRNRNALSCAECRRLKLKCSRIWPCTSCVKRKCAHICPDDVLKEVRPSRSKEVGALQSRIRELEASLAQQNGTAYGGPRTRPQSPTNASSSIHDEGSYQSYEPYNSSTTADANHQPGIQDVAEVMGTLLLGDDGSSRYLGKSAANALFHEDGSDDGEGSAGSQEDEDDLASTFSGRFQPGGFPMVSRGLDVEDFQAMLPSLPEGQRLANAYYTNCAYMFEPLRRDAFDKYLSAAYNFNMPDPLPLEQLACVFMVMALGVLFDLDVEFRDPSSTKYHNIAQACLTNAKFLNVPSLASIQCLHLMSTWQLTTHSQTGAFRAWPLLGLAGRMVLSTGIHRDGSIWAIPDPHLTIRRQLFWELTSYDRFQGLILGRPYMLNSKHFDTLMPEGGPENSGESIEYHRAKWQFSLLVGELCDECLSVGRPGYDTILLHDRKIRTFKENLPAWLRFDPQYELSQPAPEPGSREFRQMQQRHALVVMIHETLLFLHRVAFANAIENYPAEPLRSPWAQSVVSLCLEAARTLIGVTRSAFHSYPKLAARWWLIQIHCFGAATCLAAVCIKAPASALTRLAWAELCDAVNLLENQIPEGGHARDLAPRLKRLREQAQLKLDAYQQSIISSNYPGISSNYDNENRSPHHQHHHAQSTGMGDSPPEDKSNHEDDKLAVLGTATRVLEGKLRQTSRNHPKHIIAGIGGAGSSGSTGGNKSGNSPYGSNSGISSTSSTSYPYTNSYSPSFGQQQQQGGSGQSQLSQGQGGTGTPTAVPVYSASTPTAQSQPFAMGKGAMPVNVGYVDQSLAELLAEVSSPGRDPTLASGGLDDDDDEDDSGMMYFNMPSGNTPSASTPQPSGGLLKGSKSPGDSTGGENAFSSFSFTTGNDGFKAPRNPSSSSAAGINALAPISLTQNPTTSSSSSTTTGSGIPTGSISQQSTTSSSGYTALPDAGVSPSSGINFGSSASDIGSLSSSGNGGVDSANSNSTTNSTSAGGSSFLSSIPGLMAPSPGTSPYASYSPADGRRSSIHDGMTPEQQQQQQLQQGLLRTSQGGQPSSSAFVNDGRSINIGGAVVGVGGNSSSEDSYLDTAWMDYFPTPGVGLFPQSTGLLFGGSSGTTTPNNGGGPPSGGGQMHMGSGTGGVGGNTLQPSAGRNAMSFSSDPALQYHLSSSQQQQGMQQQAGGAGGGRMQYHSPPLQQNTHQMQQHQHQQIQQQQQQRDRYLQQQQPHQQQQQQPGPGGNNMSTYRVYDDLFNSVNNRY